MNWKFRHNRKFRIAWNILFWALILWILYQRIPTWFSMLRAEGEPAPAGQNLNYVI